jgi:hypothetical protein
MDVLVLRGWMSWFSWFSQNQRVDVLVQRVDVLVLQNQRVDVLVQRVDVLVLPEPEGGCLGSLKGPNPEGGCLGSHKCQPPRAATSSMMLMSVFITALLGAFEELFFAAPTATPVVITLTVRRGLSIDYATSPDSSALRCVVMPL